MPAMRNMAIKHKLISIIMLTCITTLLLAGATLMAWEWTSIRRSIVRDLLTHAEMTADNCKAALAFDDAEDAKETLKTLRADPSVVFGCIYDKNGKVFASYDRDPTESLIDSLYRGTTGFKYDKKEYYFGDGYLMVFKDVVLDNEIIGTMCIRSDLSPLYAELRRNIKIIAAVLVLCSLTAYMVSSRLQKIISDPILALAGVANSVSEKGDYSHRAPKQTNDEIGLLIDAFNEMLGQIQQRDSELVIAKEQLETRVQERTAELTIANRELQNSMERAQMLAKEATQASEAKSQFLANMSHEIRTPMNGIIGFAEILADEQLTEEQEGYVNIIRDSGRELLVLINDILDVSKIEANKLETEIKSCSLGKLLNSVESLMKPKAADKGLEFKVVESPGLPAQICTDPARLRQCLINLVGNAIKFTNQGHVYVNVSIEEENGETYIHFDVEDTGIGIPEDKQETIFELFTQADGSHTRKFGGSGLGLTITKQLAEIMGGRLTVRSRQGQGSIFSLTVPAGAAQSKQEFLDRHNLAEELRADQHNQTRPEFSGQVLVAEDVLTNQALIKSLLKRMGIEVTIVEDGNQAVQEVLSGTFDLILMDMQMPNMNGYEAARALRKAGIATPIVALTAHAMKDDDNKCLEAGCDDYLSKPIDRQRLLDILAKYLPARTEATTAQTQIRRRNQPFRC